MLRQDISRLRKNRSTFLSLGLVLSLSFVALAFNYTAHEYERKDYAPTFEKEDLDEVKVVRTPPEQRPQLPPPVFKVTEVIIPEEPTYTVEPEPLPVKVIIDPNAIVDPKPTPAPVVIKAPVKPVVIPQIVEDPVDDVEFVVVEDMPRFPGCEEENMSKNEKKACAEKLMMEYIYSKVKYPEMARSSGVEGTVIARFVVERDGSISGLKILKEPGAGTGREVKRIVNNMPKWIPGKQRGRAVRVQFNLPVKFRLD